ncbi:MAG: GNAT family N-acetyltransferase [Burkholderiales bacterium]
MSLTFVPVQSLPFSAWEAMWLQYAGPSASTGSAVDPAATFARLANPEINLHGIAALKEQAVGFAHFYFHASTWSATENCCLQDLYVAPGARGQRIGKTLVEAVAAAARSRHCSVLHWRTRESNASAQALYSQFAERTDFLSYRLAL